MEGLLRSTGFKSQQKWTAAERIYAYRLDIATEYGRDFIKVKHVNISKSTQVVKLFNCEFIERY